VVADTRLSAKVTQRLLCDLPAEVVDHDATAHSMTAVARTERPSKAGYGNYGTLRLGMLGNAKHGSY
jgi:hypothetical protein